MIERVPKECCGGGDGDGVEYCPGRIYGGLSVTHFQGPRVIGMLH